MDSAQRYKSVSEVRRETRARAAARAGALVTVYLAMNYVAQLASLNSIGVDTYGNTGRRIFVIHIVFVVLSAFLTWRILARQSLWAAIFATAWYAIDVIIKGVMMSSGTRYANTGLIFMFVVIPTA